MGVTRKRHFDRAADVSRWVAGGAFAVALAACALWAGGCDRPFIEQSSPEIELVEPDTNQVVTQSPIEFRVRASSFRPIDRVVIRGQTMTYDPVADLWSATLTVGTGINEITITAYDIQEVEGVLEVAIVHLSPFAVPTPSGDLTARGNHAAILTRTGTVLVTGGTTTVGGSALDDAFTASPDGTFRATAGRMTVARAGHTLVNIPDGRVLLLGGAIAGRVEAVSELVETVDLFDPETGFFRAIPVEGDPIRRMEHTASGRITPEGFRVDLFGGIGDVEYRPETRLGIRDDIRSFVLARDTLFAVGPGTGGFLGVPAIHGHTQTSLSGRDDLRPDNFLYHGSYFGSDFTESTSFTVDFGDPLGLLPLETGVTLSPRTQHASAELDPGLVATFGGIQGEPGIVIGSIEVFVEKSGRFLRLSAPGAPFFRSRHTATKLPDNRILLVGGFSANGNSLSLVEYFVFNAQ
jgi:hypothetical protein